MAEQEKDQHLDEMLDSLLASYSNEDPRPGMETRILATLEARERQRRRGWVLVFAGSMAVILLALAIKNARSPRHDVMVKDVPTLLPAVGPGNAEKFAAKVQTASTQRVHQRRETLDKSEANNRAILQMADLTRMNLPADEPPSEPLKLSPVLIPQQDPKPAIAQLPSPPDISIQNLGVPTMEIKELTSAKDADEKGNL
jgi:hypothetical protein